MTFAVVLNQENGKRIVGTLWADDETNARSLAPQLCDCGDASRLTVCRTEDREIPLRLAQVERMNFS